MALELARMTLGRVHTNTWNNSVMRFWMRYIHGTNTFITVFQLSSTDAYQPPEPSAALYTHTGSRNKSKARFFNGVFQQGSYLNLHKVYHKTVTNLAL
jgi:hypothetical protein